MENTIKIMVRIMNKALGNCKEAYSYRGYRRTVMAWKLVWDSEENFSTVKHNIYEAIALKEGCKPATVCSSIRTIAEIIWKSNPEFLRKYDDSLVTAPSNGQFLVILLRHLNDAIGDDKGPKR